MAEGNQPWALPWPCIYEFIRVVTHPRVFDPPSQLETVLDNLDSLFQSPSLNLLRERPRHAVFMQQLLRAGQAAGNLATTRTSPHSFLNMVSESYGPPTATSLASQESASTTLSPCAGNSRPAPAE